MCLVILYIFTKGWIHNECAINILRERMGKGGKEGLRKNVEKPSIHRPEKTQVQKGMTARQGGCQGQEVSEE